MYQLRHLALGLAGICFATSAFAADDESSVKSLKADNFKDFITQHDLVLAEFFAPWCGHCKALAPEYELAASELKEKNIPLVKVDCTEEAALCEEYGVEGYPTLKVFRGLESTKPYNGARKSQSIVSFMIKQSLPAVSKVTSDTFETIKGLDKIVVVGYFKEDDKASNETFTSIAEALRDEYLFAGTNDATLAEAEGVSQPAIVLYKDFDDRKDIFVDKFDKEAITHFVKTASTPLVGEVGPETYSGYMAAGIPLAYIFAETLEEREQFAADLKPLARKLKGAINFATIDAKAFGAHAGNLNLDPEKFPAFAIQDTVKNTKFPYDQTKKIDEKDISQFVQDVLDGKIEPSIKSEPVPESQEGPVTVVVGHSYEDIVKNNDKDVLLEFYAPWCGHCKALAPKYEQLASLYANNPEFSSKVVIAKIDATANDVPDEIQGFPTIKLYPAGSKDSPVEYRGTRTVEDLANFIRDNGKYHVDAYVKGQVEEGGDVTGKPKTETVASTASTESGTPASSKQAEATVHEEL
ncbi:protein disulfide-isomerase precursor [Coccidioides posadasii str. Silveira]|uniref:Protein disulfide-isomerase n=3 Tax=Coccidioides posadasii TaxID=199306 RepID=D1MGT5_COCPS|nr:protein disulfide-isomerase precursor, putative [Coccidioides posadasii C735 delta SOWgp]ACZ28900.1 protein disulfide isomerase [Coccidioides posadasii str. Silveira]KMM68266.1 disulfide-isomerase [Coccidioides posadasii RMSCC 3488]EER28208.1 protein disulfide-isomerase precursor, putative [Coccidioides posadasii C735 delta SOWgp]EFW23399.1 protein disulfide isomerase Pdi1 [Coccidioides posadasii str. Silveira]QVM12255.1 protein disulfide-isomerase precursor [Coccidioides posadasii str. Sil|eukprot:XP_003070353.1 protein disulfide-isomerase precursor, putative [Coccidioides posadasii C735 delta SOWgp]